MAHHFRFDSDAATVETSSGVVRGYLFDGLAIFKGIPYARARRFHAPEPCTPTEGVFDATSYGYVCPLLTNDRPNGELYVPHRFWPMDEDCLNLNIWTPAADDAGRPVMVWLHGGGFSAGSAIEHITYDGANMARFGDAVVVTVNHRLNILGYFDLSDYGDEYANSANAGTDDIVAALRWIHDNIARFGGDPENVTVFGQSGGGAKVTALLQTPAADGLYARGVNMSGITGFILAEGEGSGRELAEACMAELGVHDVHKLERVEYRRLAAAYLKAAPKLRRAGKYTGCVPKRNAFYLGDPAVYGFRRETAGVPLLVGSVFSEFFSFSPAPWDRSSMDLSRQRAYIGELAGGAAEELIRLFMDAYPERRPIDLARIDYIFRAPEIDYIARRSALNRCTYSYLFNLDQPINGGTTPWHCSDIPYFFHNIDLIEHPHDADGESADAHRVEEELFGALMAFARTGSPENDLLPIWQPCREGAESTMIFGGTTRLAVNHDHRLMGAVLQYLAPAIERLSRKSQEKIQH